VWSWAFVHALGISVRAVLRAVPGAAARAGRRRRAYDAAAGGAVAGGRAADEANTDRGHNYQDAAPNAQRAQPGVGNGNGRGDCAISSDAARDLLAARNSTRRRHAAACAHGDGGGGGRAEYDGGTIGHHRRAHGGGYFGCCAKCGRPVGSGLAKCHKDRCAERRTSTTRTGEPQRIMSFVNHNVTSLVYRMPHTTTYNIERNYTVLLSWPVSPLSCNAHVAHRVQPQLIQQLVDGLVQVARRGHHCPGLVTDVGGPEVGWHQNRVQDA